jgi:hypothetical protein
VIKLDELKVVVAMQWRLHTSNSGSWKVLLPQLTNPLHPGEPLLSSITPSVCAKFDLNRPKSKTIEIWTLFLEVLLKMIYHYSSNKIKFELFFSLSSITTEFMKKSLFTKF